MPADETIAAVFNRHAEHRLQLEELLQLLPHVLPDTVTMTESFDVSPLIAFIESVVNLETGSMVVSRQLVNYVVSRLEGESVDGAAPGSPAPFNVIKSAFTRLIGILQPRAISYEEQMSNMFLKLANLYEMEGQYENAANHLSAIPLESGQRSVPHEYKCDLYLRVARLYLDAGNGEQSEKALNRVSLLIQTADNKDDDMNITYKALHARVLDSRRRFIDAGARLHELSCCRQLSHGDQMEALSNAITCTLLAQPGKQRSRMLTALYKDERSASTKAFALLEKTYLCRIIKETEVAEFESSLKPHQITNENGENIIRNVLMEHNLLASSNVYLSISLSALGALLGIGEEQAEKVASDMISTSRLQATIDQVNSRVQFHQTSAIERWDQHISDFCEQVTKVYDAICSKHPEFVESIDA